MDVYIHLTVVGVGTTRRSCFSFPQTHLRLLPRHVTRAAETANTCGLSIQQGINKQVHVRLQMYGLLSKAGHSYTTDTDSHESSTECYTLAYILSEYCNTYSTSNLQAPAVDIS